MPIELTIAGVRLLDDEEAPLFVVTMEGPNRPPPAGTPEALLLRSSTGHAWLITRRELRIEGTPFALEWRIRPDEAARSHLLGVVEAASEEHLVANVRWLYRGMRALADPVVQARIASQIGAPRAWSSREELLRHIAEATAIHKRRHSERILSHAHLAELLGRSKQTLYSACDRWGVDLKAELERLGVKVRKARTRRP